MNRLLVRPELLAAVECERLANAYFAVAKSIYEEYESPRFVMKLDDFMEKTSGSESDLLLDVRESVLDEVKSRYFEPELFIASTTFTEMRAGAHVAPRTGAESNHHMMYRAFIYLNTGGKDFSGGLLTFGTIGTTPWPDAGTLVAHPAVDGYEHAITPVTAGRRLGLSFLLTRAHELTEEI